MMKTKEQKFELSQGNSSTNQEIKGKFVGREVYCHIGSLVSEIMEHNPEFEIDNFENLDYYWADLSDYEFEGSDEERTAKIEELEELEEPTKDQINDIELLKNAELEYSEIFEYWAVSSMMYENLKSMGHPVCEFGLTNIWGRCTTGQAILLDYAITKICADMEILEFQKYSWAK